jgi:hypothetical protein
LWVEMLLSLYSPCCCWFLMLSTFSKSNYIKWAYNSLTHHVLRPTFEWSISSSSISFTLVKKKVWTHWFLMHSELAKVIAPDLIPCNWSWRRNTMLMIWTLHHNTTHHGNDMIFMLASFWLAASSSILYKTPQKNFHGMSMRAITRNTLDWKPLRK